jgi:uncharacterized protein (UPF0332 family)
MAFKWTEFILFAEQISKNSSDEATLRSAISRAYYGAFGKVRIYCESKYKISKSFSDGIHQKVIHELKTSAIREEYSLGNSLSDLRRSRNMADYDSHADVNKRLAEQSIKKSNDIIKQLNKLIDHDS